jgi:hypothetical protein
VTKSATRYRIVDITPDGRRHYISRQAVGEGGNWELGWTSDVRDAHIFESRDLAIAAAEKLEERIRTYRISHSLPPRRDPVRIVPTTGGNWVEWRPSVASPGNALPGPRRNDDERSR